MIGRLCYCMKPLRSMEPCRARHRSCKRDGLLVSVLLSSVLKVVEMLCVSERLPDARHDWSVFSHCLQFRYDLIAHG